MVRLYGVLPRQELQDALQKKVISTSAGLDDDQLQPASIDLRLGDTVTCIRSSFLPQDNEDVQDVLRRFALYEFSLTTAKGVLMLGETYVVPLLESCNLPSGFFGEVNPKSTTGRTDTLTRVLTSGARKFDTMERGNHVMYVEITPLSFPVQIKERTRLSQLRLSYGDAVLDEAELKMTCQAFSFLRDEHENSVPCEDIRFKHGGIEMTADLEAPIVAYRAKRSKQLLFNLSAGRGELFEKRFDYFDAIERPANGEIVLEPGYMYLIATRERVQMPGSMCGKLHAYDVTSAEGRTHYAGFADPGFPCPITLEMRIHHTPFRVVHKQPLCILQLENMRSEPVDGEGKVAIYGTGIYRSNYSSSPRGPNLPKQMQSSVKIA